MTDAARNARVPRPALMLVTDRTRLRGRNLVDVVTKAIAGGVNIVQLRDAQASSADLTEMAKRLREFTEGRALILVNGDIEAALAAEADGLHVPEQAPEAGRARGRIGTSMLISRAVHGIDAARKAEADGADLLVLGTVFETASKPGASPLGIDGLIEVVTSTTMPVLGIGGVTAENAPDVMVAGAAGVAVIGAILDAPDPREAAARLAAAIGAKSTA